MLYTPAQAAAWLRQRTTTGVLHSDSRQVRAGDGFLAWPGAHSDGRSYVTNALAQGAAACLVESEGLPGHLLDNPAVASYARLKGACGEIAAAYYEQPSQQLDVLAVTGTNGKTSSAWWLAQALTRLPAPWGRPCGLIGTLGIGTLDSGAPGIGAVAHLHAGGLTTPEPLLLQRSLREFAQQGLRACAMEASSIGLAEQRLNGTHIRVAMLTNLTQDHLDYHGSMAAYWQAKRQLFDWPSLRAAVVNIDDEHGAQLAQELAGGTLDLWTVSCQHSARLQAQGIELRAQGLCFTVVEDTQQHAVHTRLIGRYNVSNLLGVLAALRALGVPLEQAAALCSELPPVPGRMEIVTLPPATDALAQPMVVVDYAHTPDALSQALQALRPLAHARGGQLWCVFGCGGERDSGKRPLMGAAARQYADCVVLTSDNPRGEKPQTIISQILLGMLSERSAQVEVDRARAIASAVSQAQPDDVVLIAGKGHEDTQETAGVKRPFSDQAHARAALAARQREVLV